MHKLILLGLLSVGLSQATVLTFTYTLPSGGPPSNYDHIPNSYGDNVTATTLNSGGYIFSYGQGNGFTPNVVTDYRSALISDNSTVSNSFEYWSTGYGDLTDIAYCPEAGCNGEYADLTLTADTGFDVRLNSFLMAGYSYADHPNSNVRVFTDGIEQLNFNGTILGTNGTHSTFSGPYVGHSITIRFGYNDWNVGLDNVNFDQVSSASAPEPATWAFAVSGLGILVMLRRKARSAEPEIMRDYTRANR